MSDISMILKRIGATLVTDVAPKLEGDYSNGHANMSGLIAAMAGDMWDREVDLLVTEIAALRELLEAGGIDHGIQPAPSFKVSDLKATRNALAEELITLQSALETRPDDASKSLNTKIWGHLLATSAARIPSPPQFGD
ncbi:MAG: hypothetical protein WA989_12915 [Henriciella sp.]|uniref:hypothetical protein n=1 Tax=Henriciella sp. TaxID=1968823 RepID=UPI003C78CD46